jgi:hypothetical protein
MTIALGAAAVPASARTELAGNERGDQILLDQVLSQTTRPLFAAIRPAGRRFDRLRPISGKFSAMRQEIAMDGRGGAVAVWRRTERSGRETSDLVAAVRPPGGRFGRPHLLSHQASRAQVKVNPHGDAIVAWATVGSKWHYSFRPAGGGFQHAGALPGAEGPGELALDADGGTFAVYDIDDPDTYGPRTRSAYRPPGGDFGHFADVSGPIVGEGLRGAKMGSNARGDTLLVWPFDGDLNVAERPAGATSFGEPSVAPGSPGQDESVAAVTVGRAGEAAIAYGRHPIKVVTRDRSGAWSAPRELGSVAPYDRVRMRMNANGDAAIAWGARRLRVRAAYRAASGTFSAPVTVAPARPTAPQDVMRPALAIDGRGRATVTWERSDGAHVYTLARSIRNARLGRPRLLARKRSFVREGPRSTCTVPYEGQRIVRRTRLATLISGATGEYYGCLLARGTRIDLGGFDGIYPPKAIAGSLVAAAIDFCEEGDDCATMVEVVDLRDEWLGVNRFVSAGPGYSEIRSLVLKRDGAVAWAGCSSRYGPAYGRVGYECKRGDASRRVFALDRRSRKPRQLDVGRRIDPKSLRLRGSRLSWLKAGRRRYGRLR